MSFLLLGQSILAQGPGTPGAEPPPPPAPDGFLDIVLSGGIIGVSIILLLLALSVAAAYLVFEQVMTLRHKELMPPEVAEQARPMLTAGRTAELEKLCRDQPSMLSFVVLSGLAEIEGGWESVEKAIEDAVAEQAARLFRKIEYLSVIGNIAPMVGLLGTVTGMIFAFQQVAATQGAAGAGELAEGIYQALVTTVGGLIVAIPALGRVRRVSQPGRSTSGRGGIHGAAHLHSAEAAGQGGAASTKRTTTIRSQPKPSSSATTSATQGRWMMRVSRQTDSGRVAVVKRNTARGQSPRGDSIAL